MKMIRGGCWPSWFSCGHLCYRTCTQLPLGTLLPGMGKPARYACALRLASGAPCGLRAAPESAPTPAGRRQEQLPANYFSPTDTVCLWLSSRLPLFGLPLLPPVTRDAPFHSHLPRPPLTIHNPWPCPVYKLPSPHHCDWAGFILMHHKPSLPARPEA